MNEDKFAAVWDDGMLREHGIVLRPIAVGVTHVNPKRSAIKSERAARKSARRAYARRLKPYRGPRGHEWRAVWQPYRGPRCESACCEKRSRLEHSYEP